MNTFFSKAISLFISLWIAKVFLLSLPYKFTKHPDTVHIFSTIGQWISTTIQEGLGYFFSQYAAYVVGSVELLASLIVLVASVLMVTASLKKSNNEFYKRLYLLGGILSSSTMIGAAFFHLFTPLGIAVIHEGKSDGGSLFYAAVSIIVLGSLLAFINRPKATV